MLVLPDFFRETLRGKLKYDVAPARLLPFGVEGCPMGVPLRPVRGRSVIESASEL